MSSISGVAAQQILKTQSTSQVSDPDGDGDNDAGVSAAQEASESSFGPATNISLSPAAQALVQGGN
jgi:hypothetical protein